MSAVCQFWLDFSMPGYLQLDNELSFRVSNRYPRNFAQLIRLALSENITPVFIPPDEPWRSEVIEKFNDNVQKYILNTQTFSNFEQQKERAVEFMAFYNQNHRYSTTGGNTPNQIVSDSKCSKFHTIPDIKQKIPMDEGEIVFIRFIRRDCKIKILDMQFELKKELMYSYVIARIIVKRHILLIEREHKVFHVFPFQMPVDY
jgi:putative transposase